MYLISPWQSDHSFQSSPTNNPNFPKKSYFKATINFINLQKIILKKISSRATSFISTKHPFYITFGIIYNIIKICDIFMQPPSDILMIENIFILPEQTNRSPCIYRHLA
jgi:hypothetical protein